MLLTLNRYPFIATRLIILLVIYTISRCVFIAYNWDLFPQLKVADLSLILMGGVRFDLTAALYTNLFYFLFIVLPLSPKFESTKLYKLMGDGYFILVNSIAIAANMADTVYYRFTLHRTTFSVFDIFKNEENMSAILLSSLFDFWPVTISFIALVALLMFSVKSTALRTSTLKKRIYYPLHTSLTVAVLALSVLGIRGGFGYHTRPISMNHAGDYVSKANHMSMVLNTPFTFLRTINKKAFERVSYFSNEQSLEQVFNPVHKKSDTPIEANKLNVVVLILESFGAEKSKRLNPSRDYTLTPFLDSLMERSLVFNNAFSHGTKSIDAIPAVVAGIPSMKVPYVISPHGTNDVLGVGSVLKKIGYHTAFYHGAPNGSMGFSAIMKLSGFDDYQGMDEFIAANLFEHDSYDGTWGIWDEEFLNFMSTKLSATPQPFIATFFSLSSHHPFVVPEKYSGQFKQGTKDSDVTYQYADHALKSFFEHAQQQPWFDNTIFVITADHASQHESPLFTNDLGVFRIPIILHKGDGSLLGVNSQIAQQSDISPTILDLLSVSEDYFSFGNSLIAESSPKYAISFVNNQYQIVMEQYVLQFDGEKATALYNFDEDKMLNDNLLSSPLDVHIQIKEKMTTFIKAVIQQYNNRMIDNRLTVD